MILATTPTDAEKYPWSDLAAIYAQRWDIELCLRARFVGGTGSVGSRDFRLFAGNNPCINTGLPGNSRLDPDGTRNDMGAYGGPGAQRFYTSPNDGPFIRNVTVRQVLVPEGATFTIDATGAVRGLSVGFQCSNRLDKRSGFGWNHGRCGLQPVAGRPVHRSGDFRRSRDCPRGRPGRRRAPQHGWRDRGCGQSRWAGINGSG